MCQFFCRKLVISHRFWIYSPICSQSVVVLQQFYIFQNPQASLRQLEKKKKKVTNFVVEKENKLKFYLLIISQRQSVSISRNMP